MSSGGGHGAESAKFFKELTLFVFFQFRDVRGRNGTSSGATW